MSGIAGILHFDQSPIPGKTIAQMTDVMSRRGPDGINFWKSGNICFGQCMLHTTPESKHDRLPRYVTTTQTAITVSGRIDNRDELSTALHWLSPTSRTIPDSDYILAAYHQWGTNFVSKLKGDYAVAIWDGIKKRLLCFRDRMGVKPLFYYQDQKIFAFASEIKALLTIPAIPKKPNLDRIADFICIGAINTESTFFHTIKQVPPASLITISNKSTKQTTYWKPTPYQLHCRSDEDYEETYRTIFSRAVKNRLRSVRPIGAFLSGGLDSSSIVSSTLDLYRGDNEKLHTYSGFYDQLAECDERHYFSSYLKHNLAENHLINGEDIKPSIVFEHAIANYDHPVSSLHFFLKWTMLHEAKAQNIGVMLDGHDGDSAVSYGYGLLPELALKGRLLRLAVQYYHIDQTSLKSLPRIVKNILLCSIKNAFFRDYLFPEQKAVLANITYLSPHLLSRTTIKDRLESYVRALPNKGQNEKEWHFSSITLPTHNELLLLLDNMATSTNLELRFPFFDSDLIDYCISLPAEQKLRKGLNRNIVRRSLKSIMPAEILNRKDKTSFTKSLMHAYLDSDGEWLRQSLSSLHPALPDIVDLNTFSKTKDDIMKNRTENIKSGDLCIILRLIGLSKWLKKNNF